MPCDQTQNQLHGYLDGELDPVSAASFEKHLETCPDCKQTLAVEESLHRSIQAAGLYERAPESLRRKLLGEPQRQSAPVRAFLAPRTFSWQWLAAAAALLLAVLVGWQQLQKTHSPTAEQLVAASYVDAHLRSLQPGHLTDVESTDQHTVKPWFDGRIDFAPPVRDYANDGFPLLGGRLDVAGGRTVAALVYGRRKHIINVFIERAQPQSSWIGAGDSQGYHWLAWQQNGFSLCAVSDVSPADLAQLRELITKN
ncbi:MAG TPA: anti-sigma factor [Candidatus Limnocylindrales bacterium]|nr:anti-sigma factor [Candidatus Limnocylindrales bacterium]